MWAIAVVLVLIGMLLIRKRRSKLGLFSFLAMEFVHVYGRLWKGCVCVGGKLPIPEEGSALIVVNHTCSADASFLQTHTKRILGHVMADDFYEGMPQLRFLFDHLRCVPVKRKGLDFRAVPRALRFLKDNTVLCIWPEGGLSAAGKKFGRRARCGVALIALRSRVPVYPVFIAGGHQCNEVGPAWLGPCRAVIYPGPPVDLSKFFGRKITRPLLEEVTHYLMGKVFELDPELHQPVA